MFEGDPPPGHPAAPDCAGHLPDPAGPCDIVRAPLPDPAGPCDIVRAPLPGPAGLCDIVRAPLPAPRTIDRDPRLELERPGARS